MFTRYSNIEIPKNYSGNRFKKTIIEDTTMKTHENEMQGAIKSSVSPTYSEHLYQNELDNSDISNHSDAVDNNISKEEDDRNIIENDINEDTENNQGDECANCDLEKEKSKLSLAPIFDYLRDIKSDDMLLILLIIILASDRSAQNNDIIMLLALLLTSK